MPKHICPFLQYALPSLSGLEPCVQTCSPGTFLRTASPFANICQADTSLWVPSLHKAIFSRGKAFRDPTGIVSSISFNSPGLNAAHGPQNNPFPPQLLRLPRHLFHLNSAIENPCGLHLLMVTKALSPQIPSLKDKEAAINFPEPCCRKLFSVF